MCFGGFRVFQWVLCVSGGFVRLEGFSWFYVFGCVWCVFLFDVFGAFGVFCVWCVFGVCVCVAQAKSILYPRLQGLRGAMARGERSMHGLRGERSGIDSLSIWPARHARRHAAAAASAASLDDRIGRIETAILEFRQVVRETETDVSKRLEKLENIFLLIDWHAFERAVAHKFAVDVQVDPALVEQRSCQPECEASPERQSAIREGESCGQYGGLHDARDLVHRGEGDLGGRVGVPQRGVHHPQADHGPS